MGTAENPQPVFPAPSEVHPLALTSHRTTLTSTGRGDEVILFLHAIGLDRQAWGAVAAWLPTDIRTIAVDLRGYGSATASAPVSLDGHAADLVEILDRLGVDRAHVVGHSYGGAVALTMALGSPGRVASLGMVASLAKAPVQIFEDRAVLAEESGVEAYVASTVERWFTPEECAADAAPIRYVEGCLRATPVVNWAQGWRVLSAIDVLDDLDRVTCPATVVAGEFDTSCPPASMARIAEGLPDATFHVLPGASHMLPLEQPFALARQLLAGVTRSRQFVRS